MVLALQRSVISVFGNEVEAQEIKLKKRPGWSLEQTLAYGALLLLLEEVPAELPLVYS